MNGITKSLLEHRFALRRSQYICERFEKSPNITEEYHVADHLSICHNSSDTAVIPALCEVFLQTYQFVKDWFDYRGDIVVQLWIAPSVDDLSFMTCMPCVGGYACAPGTKNGADIILIDSPLLVGKNSDENRLRALLAHEICHHFMIEISHSTQFGHKRRENMDVPMWLEEGLGEIIMTEISPSYLVWFDKRIAEMTEWYRLEEIWNDLAGCEDVDRAYLQAYKEAKALIDHIGKAETIRLLYLNRTHYINWNDLPREGEALAKARYVNNWQPSE